MLNFKFSQRGLFLLKQTSVILVISLLLLVIGYTHALIDLKILITAASLWTFIALTWFLAGQHSPTPLKIPILIWVAVYALTVIFSIDPRRSAGQMLIMSSSLFLFLLVYDLVNRGWSSGMFINGLLLAGSIITLTGLLNAAIWYRQWLIINPGDWLPSITYRPATANVLAPFNYLVALSGITAIYFSKNRVYKFFNTLLVLAAFLMLFLTSSRGGWLGVASGLVTLGFLIFIREKQRLKRYWTILTKKRILLTGLILISLISISIIGYLLYKQAIHPTHGSILSSRRAFWRIAIFTFKENPLFGQGPFTYGSAFLHDKSTPPSMIWVHAHSIMMNLMAEMGILGFGALLFLGFAFIKSFVLAIKKITTQNQPILFVAAAFLAAFLVHSLFDSLHMEPALIWSLAILLGASLATPKSEFPLKSNNQKQKPWWVLIPLVTAWLGIWLIIPYHQGIHLANQNQWQAAREKLTVAVNRDPLSAIAHQQLAIVDAVLANQGEASRLAEAINQLENAIHYEPSWALNHANLAALYATAGNYSEALISAEKSIELAPAVGLYQLQLGVIAEKNNDINKATTAYRTALELEPSWSTTVFWSLSPLRIQVLNDWQMQQADAPKLTMQEIQQRFSQNTQSTWAYNQLAAAYLDEGNLNQAEILLNDAGLAYASKPAESIETEWLKAELSALQGNFEEAISHGETALNRYDSYSIYGPGTFGLLYYAPRMFRSPAIALEIVPQMETVPLPESWIERENQLNGWKSAFQ
jgi:tetratricopeptide (TPR) repeat protein